MRILLLVSMFAVGLIAPRDFLLAQQRPHGVWLADLTWPQAETVLRPETVVVIPLGAGSKEHGPHLKLSNDAIVSDYLAHRVVEASDVVVAPSLAYHYYPAFLEYPGSTSLSAETARSLTVEAILGLARFGTRRFYVLNTGVSTTRALEPAARLLAAQGILLTFTDLTGRLDRISAPVREEEGGTHADEIETSMMLYIAPEIVRLERAERDIHPDRGPGGLTRDPKASSGVYSPTGAYGDPTLATPEKGKIVVEGMVQYLVEQVRTLSSEHIRRAPPTLQSH